MRAYRAKPLGTMAPTGISPFGRDHQGSNRLAIHWPAFGSRSGSTRDSFFTVRHLVRRPGTGSCIAAGRAIRPIHPIAAGDPQGPDLSRKSQLADTYGPESAL